MRIWKYALLLTAVCAITASAMPAEDNPAIPNTVSVPYITKKGDTLYDVTRLKLHNPELWRQIVKMNPYLDKPGRQFRRNGMDIVIIIPGDPIIGLDQFGKLVLPDAIEPPTPAFPPAPEQSMLSRIIDYVPLFIFLAAVTAVLAICWMYIRAELREKAETSGDPIVPGGVNTVDAAHARFEGQGDFGRRRFTVLNTVAGTIWGNMSVSYADRSSKARTLNGERAFQASVQYHDDRSTANIYMLAACGNDLMYSNVLGYLPGPDFRFVPDPIVETAPVADVAPAPVETAPDASAIPEVGTDQAAAEVGTTDEGITVELQPAEMPGEAALIRVTGALTHKMTVTIGARSLVLRHYPPTN